jgi:hypothetical protein
MSVEALWTATFQVESPSPVEKWENGGVVVLETGQIFGGDSQYYYVGRFELVGNGELSGQMKVVHYHGERRSAFGDAGPTFEVEVHGKLTAPDKMSGVMTRPGFGNLAFRLTKREDLT